MSDTNLIRGAYAAACGNIKDYGLAAAKGMTKIGSDLAKVVGEEMTQRRNDFQDFVDYELYRDPGMSDANFEAKTEELMQMKADYMWGDNFTRAGIMRKMGKMKIDQDSMDESITEFAEAGSKSGGKSGLSEAWTGSKMAKDIGKQLMNPKSYYNDENILVTDITIDGVTKPYSKSDIDELREKVSFDQTSNDVIVAMQGRIMDSPSDFEADGNPGVVSEQKVR